MLVVATGVKNAEPSPEAEARLKVAVARARQTLAGAPLNENPRLGQLLTMLAYTRGPYHVIVTPLVELGVFALLTALALGRWPSMRRSDDALVATIVAAVVASCTSQQANSTSKAGRS